ncbi:hypothetical protein [Streptomyces acidiscabies]|uniref:hypothetical protein n=1 Tax=Streptomyces acidiscabies TaxID=42234 RepID=UPI0038F692C7
MLAGDAGDLDVGKDHVWSETAGDDKARTRASSTAGDLYKTRPSPRRAGRWRVTARGAAGRSPEY